MNLLKALARISSMTMISRVLGLVRETMNAHQFGANAAMDAFIVAFRIPNTFRRIFAEGAFSQAFVPLLAEYRNRWGDAAAREFVADVAGLLSLILLVFTAAGVFAAPWAVYLFADGFHATSGKVSLTVELTRITFPYILLISLSSLAGSILNTWNQFSVPALTPALLNISMIGCGYLLTPYLSEPIRALAISVALGGILQLSFQIPYLAKIRMLPLPRINLRDKGVWRVVRQMGPAIFGVSAQQISILLSTRFASGLPNGSLSWINYADRLMELPAGVLGVALGTIILPTLSTLQSRNDRDAYSNTLDWGLRLCCSLALPATVALAVLAKPIIATLFLSKHFLPFDVRMTSRSLIAYAVGLNAIIMIKILAAAYYARQNIKTPVKSGIISIIVTQAMNAILIGQLAHAGLALAISLGAWTNASMLYIGLRRSGIYRPSAGWITFLLKLLLAVALMASAMMLCENVLGDVLLTRGFTMRVLKLVILISCGAATYFSSLATMGIRASDFSRKAA